MGNGSDVLREQLVFVLDIVRKRWLLFVVPVIAASLLAVVAVKLAPTTYTASSLIMLQAANRVPGNLSGGHHTNTLEQVQAVEAWLKSDHVMAELAPQMQGYTPPASAIAAMVQMKLLAASLSLEVVGNSILKIKMQARKPEGLGRNLEVVLSRLMEGLTGPEQNILSAPQFVGIRHDEEVAAAETALMRAIEEEGVQAPAQIRTTLQQLNSLTRDAQRYGAAAAASGSTVEQLRRSISSDPLKVVELEHLFAEYQKAADKQAAFRAHADAPRANYVSIFSSPDDILIVGRPKDPIAGENAARKIALALVLVSVALGSALVVFAEMMSGLLRTRRDYEIATGLPVLARLPKMSP